MTFLKSLQENYHKNILQKEKDKKISKDIKSISNKNKKKNSLSAPSNLQFLGKAVPDPNLLKDTKFCMKTPKFGNWIEKNPYSNYNCHVKNQQLKSTRFRNVLWEIEPFSNVYNQMNKRDKRKKWKFNMKLSSKKIVILLQVEDQSIGLVTFQLGSIYTTRQEINQ